MEAITIYYCEKCKGLCFIIYKTRSRKRIKDIFCAACDTIISKNLFLNKDIFNILWDDVGAQPVFHVDLGDNPEELSPDEVKEKITLTYM